MHNDYRDDNQENTLGTDQSENTKGVNSYDEQDQTVEEVRKDHQEELPGEGQAAAAEGQAAEGQTDDLREEGKVCENEPSQKEKADRISGQGASVSYTPPYYVPNVTVTAQQTEKTTDTKKEKRSAWPVLLAICALLSMVISFGVGGFAGYVGAMAARGWPSGTTDPNATTLIKSNGSIVLEEKLESDTDVYEEVYSVASLVADSVVEITTSQTETHPFYGQYVTSGAGSGVIIAQTATTGIIVTNYHVIEGASSVTVRLTNGTEYAASYRGGDMSMDIAVLYITLTEGETLRCATLGDSEKLVVGQRVVAIGNPLGSLGGTVTDGIISALDRKINIDDHVMTLLQTNTAINPGNSGGGLFDMAGRLVGIVNAKQSAEGIEGLGFAIPINVIDDAIVSIAEHGYVQNRPTLGVQVTYMKQSFYYTEGVYVAQLLRNDTPLQTYDRILALDGTEIQSKLEFNAIVSSLTIGKQVEVKIEREGIVQTVTVTVTENTLNW